MNCLLVPLICFRLMRKLERLGILGAVGMQCISLLPVLLTSQPSHSILCRYDPVELDPEEMCKMAKEQPQVVKCLLTTGNAIFSQIVPNTLFISWLRYQIGCITDTWRIGDRLLNLTQSKLSRPSRYNP